MKTKRLFLVLVFLTLSLAANAQSQNTIEGLRMEDAIINVASLTGKAVVSISTEHVTKMPGMKRYYFGSPFGENSPFGDNDPFQRFFEDFFGGTPNREYKQVGLGSGVIIDDEGYILTNEHVVAQADKITVTLPDGREFKGEVKGQDQRSDLAVVKINARNLPVAQLGDSDALKIGQWVVAIGNPFGFALQNPEPTVTVGVISALHRSLGRTVSQERDYNDLIQTDAAINPGNSGGPLVNLKGEIVGINVAIFSTSGGYQGVGFAIPVNNAKRIITNLIEGKKVLYGWLGINAQDLNEELTQYFGVSNKTGVLVAGILKDGPAEKGGIKEGDIITKLDDKNINNTRELLSILARAEVGKKVKITVIRDKKEQLLGVVIGERPLDLEKAVTASGQPAESVSGAWRGIKVDEINSNYAKRLRLEAQEGVVVVDIEPNSQADDSGIIPGDVIVQINKQKVSNLADYRKVTAGIKGAVLVRTLRGYFIIKESEK